MIGAGPPGHNDARAGPQGPARLPGHLLTTRRCRMRLSRYPINTAKETPADAEVVSHQLMLRAGLIRRLAAGIYTWLPLGLRAAAQGRAHRPRGNGPRRRARAADAGGAAGRAVAGIRPLGAVRPGAAAPEGPPRSRLRHRPHARGSHHRHRAARAQELSPAAGEFLPDPDEVPRRDPPALRRDARARVHHEGRLLVPRRRGLARRRLRRR